MMERRPPARQPWSGLMQRRRAGGGRPGGRVKMRPEKWDPDGANSRILRKNPPLLSRGGHVIFPAVLRLTKQEQLVLCVVLSLLLVGWAVIAWRTAPPPARSHEQVYLK